MITGGGHLLAKYVIHTVGPIYQDGTNKEPELLASCHQESIRIADQSKITSIAFPAISTGAYGTVRWSGGNCRQLVSRGVSNSNSRGTYSLRLIRCCGPERLHQSGTEDAQGSARISIRYLSVVKVRVRP